VTIPRSRTAVLYLAGVYTTLAIVATWPVVRAAATHLPHDLGDPVMSLSLLGWNAAVLPLSDRWWTGIGFYPVSGTLALSDPRLGVSLLTMPALWAGLPVLAYNIAFILSFALSALAAHALVFSLTRSHAAGILAGCAYGFAPFRAAHLSHIEVLSSYWMPVAMLGLHRWSVVGSRRGLIVFVAAFALQGLFCAYYLPLFGVMVAAWLVWLIVGRAPAGRVVGALGGTAIAAALLAPVLVPIASVHRALGLVRRSDEVEKFSADLSGLWSAAPELRLWPSHPAANTEGYLFPGLVVVGLIIVALWRVPAVYTNAEAGSRRADDPGPAAPGSSRAARRRRVVRALLLVVTVVFLALSALGWAHVSWRIHVAGLTLTGGSFRKPLTLACVAFAAWVLSGPRTLSAIRHRSEFAFYLWAAGLMVILALGPTPRLLGVPFLYQPPYAWLMALPVIGGSLRAPGRFGMLVALALAAAAGIAWHRLSSSMSPARRQRVTAALAAAILLEGWFAPVRIHPEPHAFAWPASCAGTPRLELPFGGVDAEAAAQYRAFLEGVRSVNGASGFFPPYITALRIASGDHDDGALEALAEHGPVCIAVDHTKQGGDAMTRWLTEASLVERMGSVGTNDYFLLPDKAPLPSRAPHGRVLGLTAARGTDGSPIVNYLHDEDPATIWGTAGPQRPGMAIELDLACDADIEQIEIAQGIHVGAFAHALAIDVQSRGGAWTTAWRGRMSGLAVRAALADPRRFTMRLPVVASDVRSVRLRLERAAAEPWAIAEATVRGRCR
jgi:hypothetical protein